MKPALDLDGQPHATVAWIEDAGHAGWYRIGFKDGTVSASVTSTELQRRYGVDPFANVNPFRVD
ncbi:hypothetical protein H7J07_05780 [Mycobacterium koreense]|uniref:Uncharacterized protein n=1 Tax=Mycolicibacillus koreensis TaxID=1069220 RepID=A0A7I7SCW8_9MYCO|nr:hypothetical protein [Mycolicibacillus koreensis]MCV7247735.1 hypothetical protein [Mycolicibacillus koreensis]OSC34740.1 hypothetical protein B8W67_05685 [Mycolicibacillus koreensis]BBY54119.1 hypothetical protein MKOR_13700 [Mycolicibacillus koreensis]